METSRQEDGPSATSLTDKVRKQKHFQHTDFLRDCGIYGSVALPPKNNCAFLKLVASVDRQLSQSA